MKYQELIALLRAEPSSENIALAQQWLLTKSRMSKSVLAVVQTFITTANETESFIWLSHTWLAEQDWSIFIWAVEHVQISEEIVTWLVNLLRENPDHSDAAKLWDALLRRCSRPDIIQEASCWVGQHGRDDEYTANVATWVLEKTNAEPLLEKAKQLALLNPENILLLSKVLKLIQDQAIERLAISRLGNEHLITDGLFLALPLLKRNAAAYSAKIKKWLRMHMNEPSFSSILAELFAEAPRELAPLVFEWLDKNPQISNVEKIFLPVFVLAPSQWLLDQTWQWIKNHLRGRYKARMLRVVFNSANGLECPKEASALADAWLTKHTSHPDAKSLLLSALAFDATPLRIDLAKRWMQCHEFDDSGELILALVRSDPTEEVQQCAMKWYSENPNSRISYAILLSLLRKTQKNEYIIEAKRVLMESELHKYFGYLYATELLRMGEKGIFESALALFEQDANWKSSTRELSGNLLLAMIKCFPADERTLNLATEWLNEKVPDMKSSFSGDVELDLKSALTENT